MILEFLHILTSLALISSPAAPTYPTQVMYQHQSVTVFAPCHNTNADDEVPRYVLEDPAPLAGGDATYCRGAVGLFPFRNHVAERPLKLKIYNAEGFFNESLGRDIHPWELSESIDEYSAIDLNMPVFDPAFEVCTNCYFVAQYEDESEVCSGPERFFYDSGDCFGGHVTNADDPGPLPPPAAPRIPVTSPVNEPVMGGASTILNGATAEATQKKWCGFFAIGESRIASLFGLIVGFLSAIFAMRFGRRTKGVE